MKTKEEIDVKIEIMVNSKNAMDLLSGMSRRDIENHKIRMLEKIDLLRLVLE